MLETLTGEDIDLDRPQGRVGLLVPALGRSRAPLPDRLIRQRSSRPEWVAGPAEIMRTTRRRRTRRR